MSPSQTSRPSCPVEHDFRVDKGNELPPLTRFHDYDELRAKHDLFWSPEAEGYYVVTRHDDMLGIFQNPTTFSSKRLSPAVPNPAFDLIPISLDPPQHTKWRHVLASYFSPRRMERMEPQVRAVCGDMIDAFIAHGACEFVTDFSSRFPAAIFVDIMGLPLEEVEQFLAWVAIAQRGGSPEDPDGKHQAEASAQVMEYIFGIVQERRANPDPTRDDIVSKSIDWRVDGEPPTDEELLLCCLTLFQAGLDTVNAELSYFFFHLATHPEDRARIACEPSIIPNAVEELLRCYPIAGLGRIVAEDTEVAGCPLQPGDRVLLPTTSAGRDEGTYENACEVDLDRESIRHLTFGAGPHRCLGSNLARRELAIALEEWHRRIPDYELVDPALVIERGGQVLGLDRLPLQWDVA